MTAADVISAAHISDVWSALGGSELRHGRGRAWWRDGDGWSVSLDDERGLWYDHRDGIGGGMLDLVVHVRGGTRADALRTVADLSGTTLNDRSPDRTAMRQTARIRRNSAHFALGARELAEDVLEELSPADFERPIYTALLRAVTVSPEAEYREWLEHQPEMTEALVYAGRERNRRLQRILTAYVMAEAEASDAV